MEQGDTNTGERAEQCRNITQRNTPEQRNYTKQRITAVFFLRNRNLTLIHLTLSTQA